MKSLFMAVFVVSLMTISFMAGINYVTVSSFINGRDYGVCVAMDNIMDRIIISKNSKDIARELGFVEYYKSLKTNNDIQRIVSGGSFKKWNSEQDNYIGSMDEIMYKHRLEIIEWLNKTGLTSR